MSGSKRAADTGEIPRWSSPMTFFLASTGMAVGLGNIWRFPFLAGENGGGAFVLVYLGAVAAIGLPIMIAEFIVGRRGGGASEAAVHGLIRVEGAARAWGAIGYLSFIVPLVGIGYYGVVAGWVLDYAITFASSGGFEAGSDNSARFDSLLADPVRLIVAHTAFIACCTMVVSRGLQGGIERLSKSVMPMLLLLLIGLVVYAVIYGDFAAAAAFLFQPDFQALTGETVLLAVGQAFFSLAVGFGALMAFGAYLPKQVSIPKTAAMICAADSLVALLAGLAIFPIMFAVGLDAGSGPGLVFITLPTAFAQIPGGFVVGAVFFLLLFIAALTTGVGAFEAVAGWLQARGVGRKKAVMINGGVAWLLGALGAMSFNVMSDVRTAISVPLVGGRTVFELLDFSVANLLLPLNGLLIALFAGWGLKKTTGLSEFGSDGHLFALWRVLSRVIAPIAVVFILFSA